MAETIAIKKLTSLASGWAPGFKRLGNTLYRILTFSPADDSVYPQEGLAVAIAKGSLSVAYGSRFLSGITVKGTRTYAFEEERYPQPEELASSLALAANEFGAPRSGLTLSIPKAWTIIRTVEFPATVKENMASVVAYEMDRLTPFTAGEAFFDFRVLKDDGEKITLLLMAARTDAVMPYIAALNGHGFAVDRISVALASFGAFFRQERKSSDVLFLEIGEREYEGALFTGGAVSRTFSGAFNSADESLRAETISSSLKNHIETSGSRGDAPKAVVIMEGARPSLVGLLKAKVNIPFETLRPADARIRIPQLSKEVPYAAVGSLAETLRADAAGQNLLKKGIYAKQKTPVAVTIVLAAAIAVMLVLYVVAPLRVEEMRLAEMTRQVSSKKDAVKKVEDLKREAADLDADIASIRSFKQDKPMAINILKELTAVIPNSAWLTRVRITETGVDIEGYASSASELLPIIEASKYFQKVEFASPTFRDTRMKADRFVIKMEIEGFQNTGEHAQKTDGGAKKTAGAKPKNEKK
jgi:Tfp pilus assembly protein PilN